VGAQLSHPQLQLARMSSCRAVHRARGGPGERGPRRMSLSTYPPVRTDGSRKEVPFCAGICHQSTVILARRSVLQPGTQSAGGDDLKALAATDAVDVKVGVECEDPAVTMLLGECDQGGIGEVHGPVSVLIHQPGAAFERGR